MSYFYQPLNQFLIEVTYFWVVENINIQRFLFISNSIIGFIFIILIFLFLNYFIFFKIKVSAKIPAQYYFEALYKFILLIVFEQAGKKALKYFSFIFSLFLFILFANLVGLLPFGFTLTSHIIITFSFGFSIIVALTIIGFIEQKTDFFYLFIPSNISKIILPFLVIIEVISYVSRAFSLSIRLFANIMSGHTLLNILSSFSYITYKFSLLFSLVIFIIIFLICFLETALACLQAYVFVVLTCIYLNDSVNVAAH